VYEYTWQKGGFRTKKILAGLTVWSDFSVLAVWPSDRGLQNTKPLLDVKAKDLNRVLTPKQSFDQ
jgi:hypothetical protein